MSVEARAMAVAIPWEGSRYGALIQARKNETVASEARTDARLLKVGRVRLVMRYLRGC